MSYPHASQRSEKIALENEMEKEAREKNIEKHLISGFKIVIAALYIIVILLVIIALK